MISNTPFYIRKAVNKKNMEKVKEKKGQKTVSEEGSLNCPNRLPSHEGSHCSSCGSCCDKEKSSEKKK